MKTEYSTFALPTILVVAVLLTSKWCQCDEVKLLDTAVGQSKKLIEDPERSKVAPKVPTEKADIVRRFFELEGISADLDSDSLLDHYGPEVVDKMSQMIAKANDFAEAFALNCQINSMLYEGIWHVPSKSDHKSELSLTHEALLNTLDLIVPNSKAQPFYALAKQTLRQFCVDEHDLCDELLRRIRLLLEQQEFYTTKALIELESFYHNWIPLAHLTRHIQNHGTELESRRDNEEF